MTKAIKAQNKKPSKNTISAIEARYNVQGLLHMMQYKRPARSDTEEQFIETYLSDTELFYEDDFGNVHCVIPLDKPSEKAQGMILWVSHTDTVHRTEGKQTLEIIEGINGKDGTTVMASYSEVKSGKSNCLGADCTTGIWIMLEMIKACVPGHYIFHRDEEVGGKGSAWLAANYADYFRENFAACIAFDRYGLDSVITEQCVGVTASNAFADSFASVMGVLSKGSIQYARDPYGTFTDSANYADLIPECTNISIGYHKQHTGNESQDLHFVAKLRDALCGIAQDYDAFFNSLVIDRAPGDNGDLPEIDDRYFYKASNKSKGYKKVSEYDYYGDDTYNDLIETIIENPETVADILRDQGFDAYDILSKVYNNDYERG